MHCHAACRSRLYLRKEDIAEQKGRREIHEGRSLSGSLAFCDECLHVLKHSKLKAPVDSLVCRENHDRLHLDKWDREIYLESLRGNVWIGGRLGDDGKVVGE